MSLDYEYVSIKLQQWLQTKIEGAGARGAVVGISGGLDSAVTAVLCNRAFPGETLGVIMPCYSQVEDTEDGRLVAEKFDINYLVRDLGPVLDQLLETLEEKPPDREQMAVANIKPRLRMTTLYYYAARNDYLVVGTDNWSELKVGYFTKHGDGGVDLAPLGRLVKTEVRELARYLGIPEPVITKQPSAGLWEGQTDEKELGLSYEVLDRYILTGEAGPQAKQRIEELAARNAHKLASIPVPRRKELDNN